jgi:capsular polysaccharide biosynthesis protein
MGEASAVLESLPGTHSRQRAPSSGDLVLFLLRNWRLIFGSIFAFGAATILGTMLLIPRAYESSAVLVIVVPKVSSDLKAASLTIQGYQRLLESDSVLSETRRTLMKTGGMTAEDRLRIGAEVETRIFVSRYSETTTLAPMIQLVARGRTAPLAADIVNTWAKVLQTHVRELMSGATSVTVQFAEEQYPKAKERHARLDTDLSTLKNEYLSKLDELTTLHDQKIAKFRSETYELVGLHQAEYYTKVGELKATLRLDARRQRLRSLSTVMGELLEEQARNKANVEKKKEQIDALQDSLAAVSPFLNLRKALTDEAFWKSVMDGRGKEPDWKLLQDRSLLSQEVNPVHRDLSLGLSQLVVELRTLGPRAQQLEVLLPRMADLMKDEDVALSIDQGKLEKLEQEMSAGLSTLREDRAAKLAVLERDRVRELAVLALERDQRLGRLEREITQEKALFQDLATQYNQSIMARAQQNIEEVRIASAAVPADRPLPRGIAVWAMVAACLGAGVGVTTAFLREFSYRSAA